MFLNNGALVRWWLGALP